MRSMIVDRCGSEKTRAAPAVLGNRTGTTGGPAGSRADADGCGEMDRTMTARAKRRTVAGMEKVSALSGADHICANAVASLTQPSDGRAAGAAWLRSGFAAATSARPTRTNRVGQFEIRLAVAIRRRCRLFV